MSKTAERSRASAVEPDRLDPYPAPREVERVFGHEDAVGEFEAALKSGRLHHAWLLIGPEGAGKATLAYRFARTLLMEAGADDALPEVPAEHPVFRKVAGLSHPNLLLIRRSWVEKSKRYSQWIGVDEVRRLRAFLGNTAAEGEWRVVVVDRADDLNQNAANAILKALEEPPPRTLFLLISCAEGRLPMTIRSRTRTLRLSGLPPEPLEAAVRAALAHADIDVDYKKLGQALGLAQGSARRALELVSGDGLELYDAIVRHFSILPDLDDRTLHKQVEHLAATGETSRLELYFSLLLGLMERLIRSAAMSVETDDEEAKLANALVSHSNLDAWARAWEAISVDRDEAFALNLDRSLLVLNTWSRLRRLVQENPARA